MTALIPATKRSGSYSRIEPARWFGIEKSRQTHRNQTALVEYKRGERVLFEQLGGGSR
jgi:hypothetical protein